MKQIILCLSVCAIVAFPLFASADDQGEQVAHAKTIRGVVQRIDYPSGTLDLLSASGRLYRVTTSPSTSIVGSSHATYEELSDIRPGAHLVIEASKVNTQLDAELITIRDVR
jgi:hypothetical protein